MTFYILPNIIIQKEKKEKKEKREKKKKKILPVS